VLLATNLLQENKDFYPIIAWKDSSGHGSPAIGCSESERISGAAGLAGARKRAMSGENPSFMPL